MADKIENANKQVSGDKKGPGVTGLTNASVPEDGTIVSFSDKIWIKGTGASRHLPEGKIEEVQMILGEKLISKGAAVETKAPPKKAAPKKPEAKDDDE